MNRAMQLNRLGEATEIVAQALTLMSTTGSDAKRQGPTGKNFATNLLLGELSKAHCDGKVVHAGVNFATFELKSIFKAFSLAIGEGEESVRFGALATGRPRVDADTGIDVVLSPMDGAARFMKGDSCGSVSAMAYGPPGAFISESHDLFAKHKISSFLVFMVGRASRTRASAVQEDLIMRESTHSISSVVNAVLDAFAPRPANSFSVMEHFTCATNVNKPLKGLDPATNDIAPAVRKHKCMRLRADPGSSLASGLTALYPSLHVDLYVGVARTAQAIQLAVAAHAMSGHLIALPLYKGEVLVPTSGKPVLGTHLLNCHHLVPGPNEGKEVIVSITGLSENAAVRGPQISRGTRVQTDSIGLFALSKATKRVGTSLQTLGREYRCVLKEKGTQAQFEQSGARLVPIESIKQRLAKAEALWQKHLRERQNDGEVGAKVG